MIRTLKLILVASLASLTAGATAQSTQSKLARQLSYVDFGVQAVGEITRSVSGPVTVQATDTGTVVAESASTTVLALGTLRYTPRPYFGLEFNGSYGRFTESFNVQPLQIQTQGNEFTFGYVITPPYTIFGVKPYASAGVGTIRFAPTRGGGQGAPVQARLGSYYNLGVQKDIVEDTFGVRVGFRQLFYQAPDFIQNYLTINKHTFTSEPMIGFYLRF